MTATAAAPRGRIGASEPPRAGSVAVIAHAGKSMPGGLPALRDCLAAQGLTGVHWYEVDKSKRVPKQIRRAREAGADLFFVWGGDGMVQRCIDALDGARATVAILPAGTA